MSTDTATVETLTAEVRVLMVGNRQITLSVARQLDVIDIYSSLVEEFKPLGRVKTGGNRYEPGGVWSGLEVIGSSYGALAIFRANGSDMKELCNLDGWLAQRIVGWLTLPLIVLAGLR